MIAGNVYRRGDVPPRTPVIDGEIQGNVYHLDAEGLDRALSQRDKQMMVREQMLAQSLIYYATEMLQGPPQEPYDGRFVVGRHHLAWDEAVATHSRLLIKSSRDIGKTFCFSMAYPIWRGDRSMPGALSYIFSANQTLAEERLQETKEQIENNPKLSHLIPERVRWSKREIRLSTGSIIRARGWGVRVRGGHPQMIVCDDILDDNSLYSETVRRRATDYFFSVPSNMIVPGGQIVVVGTVMHHSDVYARIEQTGKYKSITFPARDKQGKALFPKRYNEKQLKEKEEEIGPTRFAREFMCQPLTDAASLFPSHLFEGADVRLPYTLGLPAQYWEERGMTRYTGVDIAMSAEVGSDYFVIFTIALDAQGNRWVANIQRQRGVGFSHQQAMLMEENALMKPDVIHIESNQAQRFVADEAVRNSGLPIRHFHTSGVQPKDELKKGMTSVTVGKHSLDRGVPALRMGLERRKWRIPRGDKHSVEETDIWIGEMGCISFQDGKVMSVGEHDDTVMASWMADVGARLGGAGSFYFAGADPTIAPTAVTAENISVKQQLASPVISKRDDIIKEIVDAGDDNNVFDPFGLHDR